MTQLETRKLGTTGMTPKSLGLGGAWWHQVSERENIAGIHRALELGINYLDTYPGEYAPETFPGQNEERWGNALSGGRRQQVYLQAKVSSNAPGERHTDHSGPQTRRSVEASLKLLRTDYLDSVLIHGYDEISDVETLEDFVAMSVHHGITIAMSAPSSVAGPRPRPRADRAAAGAGWAAPTAWGC